MCTVTITIICSRKLCNLPMSKKKICRIQWRFESRCTGWWMQPIKNVISIDSAGYDVRPVSVYSENLYTLSLWYFYTAVERERRDVREINKLIGWGRNGSKRPWVIFTQNQSVTWVVWHYLQTVKMRRLIQRSYLCAAYQTIVSSCLSLT